MWDHSVRFDMGHLLLESLVVALVFTRTVSHADILLISVKHLDIVVRPPVDHRMILSGIIQPFNYTTRLLLLRFN